MNTKQAEDFLRALGAKNIKIDGERVRCSCPLAPWTHAKGTDNNPSFSIAVGMEPYFNCFSCKGGSLPTLVNELEMHVQRTPHLKGFYSFKDARRVLEGIELDIQPLPEYTEFDGHKIFKEWDAKIIKSFMPWNQSERAYRYLIERRGVSEAMANKYDLRYDYSKDMIVFPYKNVYGKVAGARGRAVELWDEEPKNIKHHDYTSNNINNASMVWYNEPALASGKPIVVVEGQFDALRVASVYPYVVANLTAKPMPDKIRKLMQADHIVLMMDNDMTGEASINKYKNIIGDTVPITIVELPEKYDDNGNFVKLDPDIMGEEWIVLQLIAKGIMSEEENPLNEMIPF